MNKCVKWVCLAVAALSASVASAGQYQSFSVAVYIPVRATMTLADPQRRQQQWDRISSQLKFDKVYLETYRDEQSADEATIEPIKKFFTDHGIRVSGGITLAAKNSGQFQTFSYADPTDRAKVKAAAELAARHFDEVILDDFFFYNTKTDADIAAKGNRTWTQYRLDAMRDAAQNLVVGPAHAVNPRVKMIIKFPNWYEHFQGSGFDLDQEPKIFDGIYTGTETRDPVVTDQHLQSYESYEIFRYYENIKPGGDGGGWVDTYSTLYLDRYAEQLWDTAFAKPPEITLFNWSAMVGQSVRPGDRAAWQGKPTNFDYDAMVKSYHAPPGASTRPSYARAAGYALETVDTVASKLGNPIGIASYKPFQSSGEDFLHNYLGMVGIPVELYPTFPTQADTVLLTEAAKFDRDLVPKIKAQLAAGKNVIVTSGLLRAMQDKGMQDIAEIQCTPHVAAVTDFFGGFGAGNGTDLNAPGPRTPVLIPQVHFYTNDAWQLVRAADNGTGYPILLMDKYSRGVFYVLTIPENISDLYNIPRAALTAIKRYAMTNFPVWMDSPPQVSLFAYDNKTFVAQSFLPTETDVTVWTATGSTLRDLADGKTISSFARQTRRQGFKVHLQPHSYEAFAIE